MRRFRRFLYILGGLLLLAGLVAATVPWWLGAALSAKGGAYGLTYARYERLGYSRFALHGVKVVRPGLEVSVDRLEADTPLLWGWRYRRGEKRSIVASDWSVQIKPQPEKTSTDPAGWMPLRRNLMQIASTLDRFLPELKTARGEVRFSGGALKLASATWEKRTLTVDDLDWGGKKADLRAGFSKDDVLTLRVSAPQEEALLDLESRGAAIAGRASLWGQTAPLAAEFPETGWRPTSATLRAETWQLEGVRLKLPATYSHVRGDVVVDWRSDRFELRVNAVGEPRAAEGAPAMQVEAMASGDMEQMTVQTLRVQVPGVKAHLGSPVQLEYATRRLTGETQFVLAADLAQQPWIPAKGELKGVADIRPLETGLPQVDLRLQAARLDVRGKALPDAEISGQLTWPVLQLRTFKFALPNGEGLQGQGTVDLAAKSATDVVVEGMLRRETLEPFWSATPRFANVRVKVQANGAIAALDHRGEVKIEGLAVEPLNPIDAELTWTGRGPELPGFQLTARAGQSELTAAGSSTSEALNLAEFRLVRAGVEELALAAPTTIRWKPELDLGKTTLQAGDRLLEVTAKFGPTGMLRARARYLSYIMFRDFVTVGRGAFDLPSLDVHAEWDRGPAKFAVEGRAELNVVENRRLHVDIKAANEGPNVRLETLRAIDRDQEILVAQGTIPFTLHPGEPQPFRLDRKGRVSLTAGTKPDAAFWRELTELSGITLEQPDLQLAFQGTWEQPAGQGHFRTANLRVDPTRFARPLPPVEGIDVVVEAGRTGVILKTFDAVVAGQRLHAHGNISMQTADWAELMKSPAAFALKAGELRIQIPGADLAAFARYLPEQIAPKGQLQLDATVSESGRLAGFIKVSGASTRPMGGLGVLQEIALDVSLDDRTVHLKEVSARLGGQPIAVTGKVEFPARKDPVYDVSVKGTNIPFVRQAGLLIRGDVDLKLGHTQNGRPRVSGEMRLHDSLFLSDVRNFMPSGGRSSSGRPPYFAVDAAPFSGWIVNVRVHGDRFLRMRTPVFNGLASLEFDLRGTLGLPRAIGEVKVDEGQILLPFAAFGVQEATGRLTEESPTEALVNVVATARKYGYDLRLEVTGTQSAPNVVFSSSPPLDSEQVLLMVMAGETPRNEVNYTARQRVTKVGQFLGQSLLNRVSGDPTKPDRINVSSGERISRQGRETYLIEYQLNDRWSLIGEYDEFDAYNVGAKWLAFSEQLRRERQKKKQEAADARK